MLANLGANVRAARKERGHTQESLARALDLSVKSVRNWETGESPPSRRNLERLSAELGRTPDWFYAVHEEMQKAA